MSERTYGIVVGIVTNVDDPSGQGRIKVQFPWLDPSYESGWAPISRPMAGGDRGHYFMPEVEDEALVGFEHGNFDHPFVLGFLHNGVDLPPDAGIDNHVRRLKTVSGHILEFDDRSGQERILLKTQGGHLLEMKDTEGTIELSSTNGNKMVIDDLAGTITTSTVAGTTATLTNLPSQIELKTVAGVSLTINDTGVTVSSAAGGVTVNALNATLNASASCTLNAATLTVAAGAITLNAGIVTCSGVVQCSTLIASSVVSSSYTPGVGNIW